MTANCEEELLDIKPDIRILCCETLSTNTDSFDVKPEVAFGNKTPTTSSKCFEFQSFVGVNNGVKEQIGHEPRACVLCHKLYPHQPQPYRDEKLHQLPLVLMDEFDIAKLIYPVISKSVFPPTTLI